MVGLASNAESATIAFFVTNGRFLAETSELADIGDRSFSNDGIARPMTTPSEHRERSKREKRRNVQRVREEQNNEGTRLRAAVIGCGRVGAIHAEALATHGRVEFVAVCDPRPDRADAPARRWGSEAFPDWLTLLASTSPDIVAIATPDDAHVEPTLASLESGSHILRETARDEPCRGNCYDRLITGCNVDLYLSFDNVRVGRLQAQYLVDHLGGTGRIVRIYGPKTDQTGLLFKKGQDEVLAPLIAAGKIEVVHEDYAAGWKPENAKRITNAAITAAGPTIDAILATREV